MQRLLLATAAVVAVAATTPSAHALAISYDFGAFTGSGTPRPGPYATVTLDNHNGPDTTVTLTLQPGVGLLQTGAGAALGFDLLGSPLLTIRDLTTGFTLSRNAERPSRFGGSGKWTYAVSCKRDSCGTGGNAPYTGSLSFIAEDISPSAFVSNSLDFYFASDVCTLIGHGGSCDGPTGVVAATASSTVLSQADAVPEPMGIVMLGTGLTLLGVIRRIRA